MIFTKSNSSIYIWLLKNQNKWPKNKLRKLNKDSWRKRFSYDAIELSDWWDLLVSKAHLVIGFFSNQTSQKRVQDRSLASPNDSKWWKDGRMIHLVAPDSFQKRTTANNGTIPSGLLLMEPIGGTDLSYLTQTCPDLCPITFWCLSSSNCVNINYSLPGILF